MGKICIECAITESRDWYRAKKGDKASPYICNKCYMARKNRQRKGEGSIQMEFTKDGKIKKAYLDGLGKAIVSEYHRLSRMATEYNIPICTLEEFRDFSIHEPEGDLDRHYQNWKNSNWERKNEPKAKSLDWEVGFVPDNIVWTNQEVIEKDIAFRKERRKQEQLSELEKQNIKDIERNKRQHEEAMKDPETVKWLEEARENYKI